MRPNVTFISRDRYKTFFAKTNFRVLRDQNVLLGHQPAAQAMNHLKRLGRKTRVEHRPKDPELWLEAGVLRRHRNRRPRVIQVRKNRRNLKSLPKKMVASRLPMRPHRRPCRRSLQRLNRSQKRLKSWATMTRVRIKITKWLGCKIIWRCVLNIMKRNIRLLVNIYMVN